MYSVYLCLPLPSRLYWLQFGNSFFLLNYFCCSLLNTTATVGFFYQTVLQASEVNPGQPGSLGASCRLTNNVKALAEVKDKG